MRNVLQQFVFPGTDSPAPDSMYARTGSNAGAVLCRRPAQVRFFEGAKFSFDTYFNGLTVNLWKESCQVDSLSLFLEGSGRVLVRLGHHTLSAYHLTLDEQELSLTPEVPTEFPVAAWPELTDGMLYVSVFALEDGEITGGGWFTDTEPCRNVELAVVVTHFNRQDYVRPAMQRLRRGLDDELSQHIDISVVDNSNNLDSSDLPGVTVIPNRNLGGSGGFARGLMEATDRRFSHCLFMDDDASCEVESVRRTYMLLAYARDDGLAVAGALLRKQEPFRLFEKGAHFDGLCRPLKSGLDMTRVEDLLHAEMGDQRPDYGGWWFFAFKLSHMKHMPFPFFVRGDDIMFCMINDFDIVTANGIACWGDDFGLKTGPLPIYLDVRNHLVQKLSHMRSGRFSALLVVVKFFVKAELSYNYATARAVSMAVRDVSEGGRFWRKNLDMSAVRERIKALEPSEKLHPVDLSEYRYVTGSPHESWLRKLGRFMTWNGFLLPGFLIKNDTIIQPKGFKAGFREVFRHRRVLYYDEPQALGYTAEYDRRRFFSELMHFAKTLVVFAKKYSTLRADYEESVRKMTTREFWDQVYSNE